MHFKSFNLLEHEAKLIDHDFFWTEMLKGQTEKTTNLIDKILQVLPSNSDSYNRLSQLYQRIFNFLIFKNKTLLNESNLGGEQPSTEDQQVTIQSMEKEVAAGLESVIPRAALSPFMMLSNTQKVTQLTELSNLVLGIRLFNKSIDKGGSSIIDIDTLRQKINNEFFEAIRENLIETVGLTEKYSYYFESKLVRYENLDEQDEILKKELMFLRQYTSMLMILMEKVETSIGICDAAEGRYLKETDNLKKLLGSKSSAPKEQVYPKFAVLANSYLQIFEEAKHAKDKQELFSLIKSIFDTVKFSMNRLQQQKGELYANE